MRFICKLYVHRSYLGKAAIMIQRFDDDDITKSQIKVAEEKRENLNQHLVFGILHGLSRRNTQPYLKVPQRQFTCLDSLLEICNIAS